MRRMGVEIDRRALKETYGKRGLLVVMDVTDQGLRRPCKVARLVQGGTVVSELKDVHIIWANEGRITLSGYEQQQNEEGKPVDYAQSWLCILDDSPSLVQEPARKVELAR